MLPRMTEATARRELRDPKALKALAHPVRLRLLEELALAGPMTATELGDRVEQSAANCSWHLRQLAQYGFVEEAGGGTGRQRPWRMVVARNSWGEGELDDEAEVAGAALSEVLIDREVAAMRTGMAEVRKEPQAWRDAAFLQQSLTWLTAEELTAVGHEVAAVLFRYFDRVGRPELRPAGARPIRFVAWGVPARPLNDVDEAGGRA
jgi:DNA-binding transcriptional ArsR family regulator